MYIIHSAHVLQHLPQSKSPKLLHGLRFVSDSVEVHIVLYLIDNTVHASLNTLCFYLLNLTTSTPFNNYNRFLRTACLRLYNLGFIYPGKRDQQEREFFCLGDFICVTASFLFQVTDIVIRRC